MVNITLPDGSLREFSEPVTVAGVAASIGAGLAKATLAGKVSGELVDASHVIEADSELQIITGKDDSGLEVLRHSCAHLLAQAVKRLFPSVQVTIGPVIEDGFYYDFAFERAFTPDDLEKIEATMKAIVKENLAVERQVLTRAEAIALFEKMGEHYKVQIIKDLPEGDVLTAYQQGEFIDLCRGPHVPRTGLLKAFKLTKLAGAYWRGDSNNDMLQRVYGTAWPDKKALQDYLHRIEEAEKRDHRKLAKKMDLFHHQQEAPGMVFWHANGWTIVHTIKEYLRQQQLAAGYQEVNTPQMVDVSLWERSGHLAKFGDEMFCLEVDNRQYAIKPMSCPCHVQIFNQGLTSYRDLPIRLAEFGCCHRNEPSGTLHGLMRARNFVQDDGHIFCTEDQIQAEVLDFITQLHAVYRDFGFTEIIHKLSTRPDKRVGSDEEWDRGEQALEQALNSSGVDWDLLPGEGAFYGPKIEFSLKDCLGRVWQCGTMQIDFSMPGRLDAHYIDDSGEKRVPVMLHRAILGSLERFIGILLEEYSGRLPLWLAPQQVVLMSITDRQHAFVKELAINLQKMGFRVKTDLRNEKIGFKIRQHTIARVPYQLVIGDREVEDQTVALRVEGSQKPDTMNIDTLIERLQVEVATKGLV